MPITTEQVEHIAHLARIELNEHEKKIFETELSGILTFVEKLNELDTKDVEPVNGGTLLRDVMREDEQIDTYMEGKSADIVDAAPQKANGFVKVKSVFGKI